MMIVFNGLKTLPKGMLSSCIKNVYPFAYEILIAEGAVRPTSENPGDATKMSQDGRSTDGTLEFLKSYPDPEGKIKIFTKDNNFWDGKLEMCNAAVAQATGDYIWQIDSDEFYHQYDMRRIISYLSMEQNIERVDFYANHFFGDFNHCCDETQRGWANQIPWMRIFKHTSGSKWKSHAPPIYQDKNGKTMSQNILSRENTLSFGIKLHHYGFVSPSQFEFKKQYYKSGQVDYVELLDKWTKDKNIPLVNGDRSKPFSGEHPDIIKEMRVQYE